MENKAIQGFSKAQEEVVNLQNAKNYEDAMLVLEKLIEIVEDAGMFAHTDSEEFFCFNNLLEQMLYYKTYHSEKKLSRVPDNYSNMYHQYGALLFETKRYDEAELFLKKALRWNPVDTDILFEFSEIYKIRGDWETYLRIMHQCLRYAYSSSALARCYRNLGFYYIEQEQYETASALYLFSLYFEPKNETAYIELDYIKEKSGIARRQPETEAEAASFIQLLKDEGIQTWANPEIVDIALFIAQQSAERNMTDAARLFFGIAYELTRDENIKKAIALLDDSDDDEAQYEHEEGKYDGEI